MGAERSACRLSRPVRFTASLVALLLPAVSLVGAQGAYPEQVLLKDLQVLTLRQGHMTTGRRASPVPQLRCVGGTAGCGAFVPQVVQCYNRGSDGSDVQWECKTDMDNAYRFGRTEVTCEGFNYPEDPYVLKGSCGVEYTIDLTKEAYDQHQHSQGASHQHYEQQRGGDKAAGGWGSLVTVIIICFIIYIVYTKVLAPPTGAPPPPDHRPPFPPRSDHGFGGPPPPYSPRDDQPPPPGFKPEYTTGGAGYTQHASAPGYGQESAGASYGGASAFGSSSSNRGGVPPAAGGGFWSGAATGAATGGLLGYLFGSRTQQQQAYPRRGWGGNTGGGWGGGAGWGGSNQGGWGGNGGGGWFSGGGFASSSSRPYGGGASSSGGSSTGTRTASGFGGTTRR